MSYIEDSLSEGEKVVALFRLHLGIELVDALGPTFEGGYFLYRFSDPTYIVAEAVVRAVAGTVLAGGGRAVDVCGGSGHLTRVLLDVSSTPPGRQPDGACCAATKPTA